MRAFVNDGEGGRVGETVGTSRISRRTLISTSQIDKLLRSLEKDFKWVPINRVPVEEPSQKLHALRGDSDAFWESNGCDERSEEHWSSEGRSDELVIMFLMLVASLLPFSPFLWMLRKRSMWFTPLNGG